MQKQTSIPVCLSGATRGLPIVLALAMIFSIASSDSAAAVDYFLKIPSVPGESTDAEHKDEIDILSYSWGVALPTDSGSGGGGTGMASFSDVTFVKFVDKASPELFNRLATGTHLPSATLVLRHSGAQPFEFMRIELENVLVTSLQDSGSAGGDVPTESFSLNYEKIRWTYTVQNPDGSAGEVVVRGWDVKNNLPYDPVPTGAASGLVVE